MLYCGVKVFLGDLEDIVDCAKWARSDQAGSIIDRMRTRQD